MNEALQAINFMHTAFGQIFDVAKAPKYTCRICEREFHSEDMTLEKDLCLDCEVQCDAMYEEGDGYRSRRDHDIIEAVKASIVRCECGEFLGYDEADRGHKDENGKAMCDKCYENMKRDEHNAKSPADRQKAWRERMDDI